MNKRVNLFRLRHPAHRSKVQVRQDVEASHDVHLWPPLLLRCNSARSRDAQRAETQSGMLTNQVIALSPTVAPAIDSLDCLEGLDGHRRNPEQVGAGPGEVRLKFVVSARPIQPRQRPLEKSLLLPGYRSTAQALRLLDSDLRRCFPELPLNVPSESFALLFEVPAQEETAESVDKSAYSNHQVRKIGADRADKIASIRAICSQRHFPGNSYNSRKPAKDISSRPFGVKLHAIGSVFLQGIVLNNHLVANHLDVGHKEMTIFEIASHCLVAMSKRCVIGIGHLCHPPIEINLLFRQSNLE